MPAGRVSPGVTDSQLIKVGDTNLLKDKIVRPLFDGIFTSLKAGKIKYNDLRAALMGNLTGADNKDGRVNRTRQQWCIGQSHDWRAIDHD